ncbi:MAG TPA: glutathione S-transferase family protein [Dongiaceae bacterium]|nr:glutathione S-transferase family protein [Dongiaceae bacterium]
MKLYYCETLNPRKVCALARHLDLPVEFVRVDLKTGEHRKPDFLAINPNGKVPVLQDGDWTLWESNAIMCHLAKRAKSDLWPEDERQIEVMRWLYWDTNHFTRHGGSLYFENLVKPALGMGAPDEAAVKQATNFFHNFAGVLDTHLKGRDFLVGNRLSIADFATAVCLPYAEGAKLPLEPYAEIRRWHAGLEKLPAWQKPFG